VNTRLRSYLITWGAVVIALATSLLLYSRYLDSPWTRDGQVRANIVGVAARVAGPIIQIPIIDNQAVKKGDLLFEIDPSTYQAAVGNAVAKLQQAEAQELQTAQSLQRLTELYKTKVIDIQEFQNAQDANTGAIADVAAAKAELTTAQLNLSYTKVFAPVDGYLTNINTSAGTYVDAGAQILALLDSSSFWVAAYFKETQLKHIREGEAVKITLMGHALQPFDGVVKSIGWAIFLSDGSNPPGLPVELLPQVSPTIDWVRLPQRFPVRVQVTGKPPIPLRIGQTASITVTGSAAPAAN